MANAFKLFDPNTGATVFRDCLTGALLTPAEIALITPCPTRSDVSSDVCLQPTGNTDPLLIETGGKQICTVETTYLADNSVDATAVVATLLIDASGADVTATHETTACPAGLIAVGEVCYEVA